MEMILGVFGLLVLFLILSKKHKKKNLTGVRSIVYLVDIVGEQSDPRQYRGQQIPLNS